MHEARWRRAKDDADKRRTRGSIFRAAISSARNERTSRLWARAALFEHAAAPGQARAAPVEHSAAPGQARAAPVEHSAPPGQARAAPIEYSATLGQTRSARFEYSAAPGRARAAISNHLRQGGLEQPFRAICGSGPGSSGHMQQIAAFLEQGRLEWRKLKRTWGPSAEANFMNRCIFSTVKVCQ